MRQIFAGFVALWSTLSIASAGCAGQPQRTRVGAEAAPGRRLVCDAYPRRARRPEEPLYPLARCNQPVRERVARELAQIRRGERLGRVAIYLSDVRGSRAWSEVRESITGARFLLGLCFRRWAPAEASHDVVLVLSIDSAGRVRVARPDRDDELGSCVAEVTRTLEFAPDGFSTQSSEVVANVSFSPGRTSVALVPPP